ncbi:MAG: hypothetical protein A2289_04695 [Deltaproteobacteria bacterium RIFOXYA12_FULL_58_15]|nr:MAG: hypothetical protein A2289_04695 [Deltaproteobacteria bacterium RIFOXYA12_FULL_58_15]
MIPSLVSTQIQRGIRDYLQTTFAFKDPALSEALDRLVRDPENGLFKGPYLSLRLPYRTADQDASHLLDIAPGFVPYVHQLRAFERLSAKVNDTPLNTLVTTGTGSGKTECFLYPILDHCSRMRRKPGIKAIILYPMNALATDQAGRLAHMIADHPDLSGVRAGIYVGEEGEGGKRTLMSPTSLITDRAAMRADPPDILLTNYRMLDFLLIRPIDSDLWAHNDPETLRYLVLDELHTYDGAQGSDVACLIRRLRGRLGVANDTQGFTCVGTSATVSSGNNIHPDDRDPDTTDKSATKSATELLAFASAVFGRPFLPDSIVGEDILKATEYLSTDLLDVPYPTDSNDSNELSPKDGESIEAYVQRQAEIWLTRANLDQVALDQVSLGELLVQHRLLGSLLAAVRKGPKTEESLCEALAVIDSDFAGFAAEQRLAALKSFVTLVSWAKRESAGRLLPLLNVQLHLWMREMRRTVRVVGADKRFAWDSDPRPPTVRALPAFYCRECGHSGWLTVLRKGDARLCDDLRDIYRHYFDRSSLTRYVSLGHAGLELPGTEQRLNPVTLQLTPDEVQGEVETLPITIHHAASKDSDRDLLRCPSCESDFSLTIVGAQNATLGAVAVGQIYGSRLSAKEEKKLLAFTDSVQDASHRAGFFSGRTYRFNLRGLFLSTLKTNGAVDLAGLGRLTVENTDRTLTMPESTATLFPPDLEPNLEHRAFLDKPQSTRPHALTRLLEKRIAFEGIMELGFNARVGRSLTKVGCAGIKFSPVLFHNAVEKLSKILPDEHEALFANKSNGKELVERWVFGLLLRLVGRGGIYHEYYRAYCREKGNKYHLSPYRVPGIPPIIAWVRRPRFAALLPSHGVFDPWLTTAQSRSWAFDWAVRCLGGKSTGRLEEVRDKFQMTNDAYRLLVATLSQEPGLLLEAGREDGDCLALRPEVCIATTDVVLLRCDKCGHAITVAKEDRDIMLAGTCMAYRCEGYYQNDPRPEQAYYRQIYESGDIRRIFAKEHTGLLGRKERESLERIFKEQPTADAANLIACTPTLEMGIDIGDLSATLLCSVPPTVGNFVQRVGRAGRATGNALLLTQARTQPHDLYFFENPLDMVAGSVTAPGIFINAPEMLVRQFVAYCLERWSRDTGQTALPKDVKNLLAQHKKGLFPNNFLSHLADNQKGLLADFCTLFGDVLTNDNCVRLANAAGQIKTRLEAAIDRTQKTLDGFLVNLRRVEDRLANLDADLTLGDEQKVLQHNELTQEQYALKSRIRRTNNEYILSYLVQEGLLPNYAFPESGVRLHTTIYGVPRGEGERPGVEQYEWVRPAAAAIREFAPFNRFYAHGRRVAVDRVFVGTRKRSDIEPWVFCSNCSYASPFDEAQGKTACPNCGETGFAQQGQVRDVVYLRDVGAREPHQSSLSLDSRDEREQQHYCVVSLFDMGKAEENEAYAAEARVFGYEWFDRVSLRELNLGIPERGAEEIELLGQRVAAPGFLVCDDCGVVLNPKNKPKDEGEESGPKVKHTPRCLSRTQKEVFKSIFLQREIQSEAVRVLLPVSTFEVELGIANFKAALELGLKRKFGGEPAHLMISEYSEPTDENGRRRFLVLYDAVPGGTGYLKELVKKEGAFIELFELALGHLQACECKRVGPEEDSEPQDGCYRCLFGRTSGRDLPLLSKRYAMNQLRQVLSWAKSLAWVPSLSDISVADVIESELEARFRASFLSMAETAGFSIQEILVSDASGQQVIAHKLKRGGETIRLVPQVRLGRSDGVDVPCEADFVLTREIEREGNRVQEAIPVAIFCDGFAYHACRHDGTSIVDEDVAKRTAVLRSGRYRVWTITWKDVADAKPAMSEGALLLPSAGHEQQFFQAWSKIQKDTLGAEAALSVSDHGFVGANAAVQLFKLACEYAPGQWPVVATAIAYGLLDRPPAQFGEIGWKEFAESLGAKGVAARFQQASSSADLVGGRAATTGTVAAVAFATTSLKKGSIGPDCVRWALHLVDDPEEIKKVGYEEEWRRFFGRMNLLQALPRGVVSTSRAVETCVDGTVEPTQSHSTDPDLPLWIAQAQPDLIDLLAPLATFDLPVPADLDELGPDGDTSECWGQAEYAWRDAKVLLLNPALNDEFDRDAAEKHGWTVFVADDYDPEALAKAVRGANK